MSQKTSDLHQQVSALREKLEKTNQAYQALQQHYQALKNQNERLLRMEAQHQSAKESLIRKRIVLSRAILLVPENMVIGDQMENCVIKIYKGNSLVVTDSAKLINCRIIGLDEYSEEKKHTANRGVGTIEIKGLFYNANPHKYAISTHEKLVICPGARFMGNVRAETIVISELTRVSGRFSSRSLLRERRGLRPQAVSLRPTNVLEFDTADGRVSSAHS